MYFIKQKELQHSDYWKGKLASRSQKRRVHWEQTTPNSKFCIYRPITQLPWSQPPPLGRKGFKGWSDGIAYLSPALVIPQGENSGYLFISHIWCCRWFNPKPDPYTTYSHRLFCTELHCLKSKEPPTESKRSISRQEFVQKFFFLLLFSLCAFPGVKPKPNLYLTFSEATFRSLYLSRQGCQSDTCGKQGSLHSVRVSLSNTLRTAPVSWLLDIPLWCCTPQRTRGQKAGLTQVAELV